MARPRSVDPAERSPALQKYYENREARLAYQDAYRKRVRVSDDWYLFLKHKALQVKGRAKLKGVPYTLTDEWLHQQKPVCAVTGASFVTTLSGRDARVPSFDQIVPGKGYTPENTQLVCCWYNYAKSASSADEIRELILQAAKNMA